MARLYGKPLELTMNLIKSMKDEQGASVSIEVALSLADTIEAQQQEIDALPVFKGEKEPEEWLISLLQTDREELTKWIGRCAWHCKKVGEQDKEIEQLEKRLEKKAEIIRELLKEQYRVNTILSKAGDILRREMEVRE